MKRIIDISVEISTETVLWPGSNPYALKRIYSFEHGDKVNVSSMEINLHTGTHIDVPLHFIADGKSASEVDLSRFCGRAKVICFDLDRNITGEDLKHKGINEGDIVLFNIARNNGCMNETCFSDKYIAIDRSAAEYLKKRKVKAVGINYLTIGDGVVHTYLLKNGIIIIETLKLSGVEEGEYEFYGFPLKIKDGEGSPIRAVLIRDNA